MNKQLDMHGNALVDHGNSSTLQQVSSTESNRPKQLLKVQSRRNARNSQNDSAIRLFHEPSLPSESHDLHHKYAESSRQYDSTGLPNNGLL